MSKNIVPNAPVFSHVEPVLAVKDINATIQYWKDILGFQSEWVWGEPPTVGAVSWQKIHVQFFLNPALADSSVGNCLWIRVRNIDALYRLHQQKGAEIVEPLENKPWGMTQYMIREINGYYLDFADVIRDHPKSVALIPPSVQIVNRIPSANEYAALLSAVGWDSAIKEDQLRLRLEAAIHGAVAEDTTSKQVIGCGLVLGDGASFFYVKDLMVRPDWQYKRIGTALMKELNNWIENNSPDGSLAALITGEALESFYQQFGFASAFAMIKYIHHAK